MKYPKPIMTKKELMGLGYSKRYLDRVYTTHGQRCCWRLNPINKSSPLMFDTEELEKFKKKEIELHEKTIERRRA